jgi:hypothetical protein
MSTTASLASPLVSSFSSGEVEEDDDGVELELELEPEEQRQCKSLVFSLMFPRENMVYIGAHVWTIPFWTTSTQSAFSKSFAVGFVIVWGVGRGPKEPCSGVMLMGLRSMFSSEAWDVSGIGEFMAMCVVFMEVARWIQMGWRVGDESG